MNKSKLGGLFAVWLALTLAPWRAHAAYVWITDLTIKEYSFYWNGAHAVLSVSVNEPITTACAKADQDRVFARKDVWPGSAFQQNMLSIIATSRAQGKRIAIQYNPAECFADEGSGLLGVRIQP